MTKRGYLSVQKHRVNLHGFILHIVSSNMFSERSQNSEKTIACLRCVRAPRYQHFVNTSVPRRSCYLIAIITRIAGEKFRDSGSPCPSHRAVSATVGEYKDN